MASSAQRSTTTATIVSAGAVGRAQPPEHHRHVAELVRRHGGRLVADRRRRGRSPPSTPPRRRSPPPPASSSASPRPTDRPPRIGIAAGDVTWEDDDCSGLPVVVAARLQDEAGDGEILVSHVVRLLAGDRLGERCEPVGAAGGWTASPVRPRRSRSAWDERRAPDGGAGPPPPLPLAWRTPAVHALVGRSDGDGRAGAGVGAGRRRRRADRAARRRGRRRQDAAGERVRPRRARAGGAVLLGRATTTSPCRTSRGSRRSTSCSAALDPASLSADLADRLAPLGDLAVHLERVAVAAAGRRPIGSGRGALPAVRGVRRSRSTRPPPAGRPSSSSTTCTGPARRRSPCCATSPASGLPGRLLVVGTFRDTGDEITEPLAACLADLRRAESVSRLRLDPLDGAAVEHFVAQAVGHPLDDDLTAVAAQLAARSGGNAFFVGELWRHLVAARAVVADRATAGPCTTPPRRRPCPTACATSSPPASPG